MNILVYSSVFYPSVGGMETFAEGFCTELSNQGFEVSLITITSESTKSNRKFNFTIYRNPNLLTELKLIFSANRIIHNCIWTNKSILTLLFNKHNYVIHHTWYGDRNSGNIRFQDKTKKYISRWFTNIAVSKAIASSLKFSSNVIHNFIPPKEVIIDEIERNKDLCFIGRLVSDKGCHLIIEALLILKSKGLAPTLTIIGGGDEREKIEKLVNDNNLSNQVTLLGSISHDDIYPILAKHKVIIVPSIWEEPFGIVALEGIMSGCIPMVADVGGLTEAIGQCGITFKGGDTNDLAEKISELLNNKAKQDNLRSNFKEHIKQHEISYIITQYKKVLQIN